MSETAGGLQHRPSALLLDFGGVIILTSSRPGGKEQFAQNISDRLQRRGVTVTLEQVHASLEAGSTALKHWKHASSRRSTPRELSVAEILDFYFCDLPDPARAVLSGDGVELLDELSTAATEHTLRTGVRELISYAQAQQIPLGIVSNAHSGRSHRRILDQLGLADSFGVQIYSDEAGIRKPHPQMLQRAADALGAELDQAWYVGDTLDRDLAAGRRAGVGAVVITRSQHTDNPPFAVNGQADAVVDDPAKLLELLESACSAQTGPEQPEQEQQKPAQPVSSAAPNQKNNDDDGEPSPATPKPVHALLLDHGGVLSSTEPADQRFAEAAAELELTLQRAGCPVDPGAGLSTVESAHAAYGRWKHEQEREGSHQEITPAKYWAEFTAQTLNARQRQVLRAEAEPLTLALYRSKSRKVQRTGTTELVAAARAAGVPVVIVSNTICGRGVREVLQRYGLAEHVTGWVCSDEFGLKKPRQEIFDYALRMVPAAAENTAMVGDKALNDAFGAQLVGIGRRILTRGGSGDEAELQQALQTGWATDLVDHPGQIPELLGWSIPE